jgi:hypothetical protein
VAVALIDGNLISVSMPFCPECGVEIDAEDVHCYNCGRNLEGGTVEAESDDSDDQWGSTWGDSDDSDDQWGSTWGEESGSTTEEPGRTESSTRGRDKRGVEQNAEASGRRIEDGKVEYTVYFPITRGYTAIGLGAVCSFLFFLIVPFFILFGYTYRITEAAARGETVQPAFDGWGDLLKHGFFYFLLTLALAFINIFGAGALAGLSDAAGVPAAGGFAVLVLWLLTTYVSPAIMVLYPVTGTLSKALSPGRIADFAFTTTYIVSYLVYVGLMIGFFVLSFIGTLVLAITVIGIFVLIPLIYVLYAYLPYAIGSFWGATYYEAAEEGLVPHVSEQDETAQTDTQTSADTGWS